MNLTFSLHSWKFKHSFNISHGSRDSTNAVLIFLNYHNCCGYGECALPPYVDENQQTVIDFLKKINLKKFENNFCLTAILNYIHNIDTNNHFAKAAIDIALHDLWGKIEKKPIYKLYNLRFLPKPTCYTIGIDSDDIIKDKLNNSKPFPILKVKLDGINDYKIITMIRNYTNKPIITDINQAWQNKHEALEKIKWLHEKNCILIEQPLHKTNYNDTAWLTKQSPIPIIADEAFQTIDDLKKIKTAYSGINIKLMKCGGINNAYKIIKKAKFMNLKIMIGCMSESSCGIAAAAHLIPLANYVDLDSPLMITNDFFHGLSYINGNINLSNTPGLGVEPIN